jgi:acetyl esterase
MSGNLAGWTYLEPKLPVVVLVSCGRGGGPRNVLVRRTDGSEVVMPFRGLLRPAETET